MTLYYYITQLIEPYPLPIIYVKHNKGNNSVSWIHQLIGYELLTVKTNNNVDGKIILL